MARETAEHTPKTEFDIAAYAKPYETRQLWREQHPASIWGVADSARIERAVAILQAAPDLNLADYTHQEVALLVSSMRAAWAELTDGKYPGSYRRQSRAGEAEVRLPGKIDG